jgi:hypothetical protein
MRWKYMAAEQSGGVVFMPQHSGMKQEIIQNVLTVLTVKNTNIIINVTLLTVSQFPLSQL